MGKYEYPVGKVNNYDINYLNGGYTLDDLVLQKSFINCDIFVDNSIITIVSIYYRVIFIINISCQVYTWSQDRNVTIE